MVNRRYTCQIVNPRTGMFCLKNKSGRIKKCSPTRVAGIPLCKKRK